MLAAKPGNVLTASNGADTGVPRRFSFAFQLYAPIAQPNFPRPKPIDGGPEIAWKMAYSRGKSIGTA